MTDTPPADPGTAPYRVLARKYRPARFADLIGQEALVRTLTNAIESGRTAHAFILTGVRGVGKTTTARIIARALNCVGADGAGGPTPEPCGACEHCTAIGEDRHIDVIEMDAASRTGIDDIRELIESVRYRPVQARNKVYIIDEVHMLSKQAFSGLLKTLEEPPEHVVFIFATTEVRKVPVTVLSRCQRFDLRRVDQAVLVDHFATIARAEAVEVAADVLAMIARAADGSVRDGLSLLDQAIALSGGGKVEAEQVRAMLGLADRARVFDLFEALMRGAVPEALAMIGELHRAGAEPAVVLRDLLELSHTLTRAKLVPETLDDPGTPETERVRGRALAEKLSLPALARTWQMLLKGLGEVQAAPAGLQAAEMVLIRLAYAADLPTPAELVERLTGEAPASGRTVTPPAAEPAPAAPPSGGGGQAAPAPQLLPDPAPEEPEPAPGPAARMPESFPEVVELVRARRETILANHLTNDVHLVHFEPGRIELRPAARAPAMLAGQLGEFLHKATGERWMVTVSKEAGDAPLGEQAHAREARLREAALEHPLVKAAMDAFPGAKLVDRRDTGAPAPPETKAPALADAPPGGSPGDGDERS